MKKYNKKILQKQAEIQRIKARIEKDKEYIRYAEQQLKSKNEEIERMKDALAECAVKEAFMMKAQAFLEELYKKS